MRTLLSAMGVLALAASASAATLKVPQQYETIQEAVNAAQSGDTIVVSKGVYYESVSVETPGLKIVGKKAVIDGTFEGSPALSVAAGINYNTCLYVYGSGVTVQGMQFRNGFSHIYFSTSGLKVLKCVSRNAGYYGFYGGGTDIEISGNRIVGSGYGGMSMEGQGIVLTKNTVQQSGGTGINVYSNDAVVDGNVVGTANDTGIYVSGSPSTVTRNRVSNIGGNGMTLYVSGGAITDNRVSWIAQSTGMTVYGNGTLVQGNTVTVANNLIGVYGYDNQVLDNRASGSVGSYCSGIQVGGDSTTISGNVVDGMAEYGTGFYIYSYGSGGCVVSNNTAQDTSGPGFEFNAITNSEVSGLSAIRCGSMGYMAAINVYGSGTTFTGLTVTGGHGDGIYVNASNMSFVSCTVDDTTINGFRVNGFGNSFTSCTAKGIGGQGFHNAGSSTVLDGGVYLDNRIDIANEIESSFSGGLASVLYETGGEATYPVLFYYSPW